MSCQAIVCQNIDQDGPGVHSFMHSRGRWAAEGGEFMVVHGHRMELGGPGQAFFSQMRGVAAESIFPTFRFRIPISDF